MWQQPSRPKSALLLNSQATEGIGTAAEAAVVVAAVAMVLTKLPDPRTPSGSNQTSTKLSPKSRSLQIYGVSSCLQTKPPLRHPFPSSGLIGSTLSLKMLACPSTRQMRCLQAVVSSPTPRVSLPKSNGSLTQVQDLTTRESTLTVLMMSSCACLRLECSTRSLKDSCRLSPSRSSAMELLQITLLPCPPSQVLVRGTSLKPECAPVSLHLNLAAAMTSRSGRSSSRARSGPTVVVSVTLLKTFPMGKVLQLGVQTLLTSSHSKLHLIG